MRRVRTSVASAASVVCGAAANAEFVVRASVRPAEFLRRWPSVSATADVLCPAAPATSGVPDSACRKVFAVVVVIFDPAWRRRYSEQLDVPRQANRSGE